MKTHSSCIAEDSHSQLVKSDRLRFGTVVLGHLGADTLLSRLRQVLLQHEIVQVDSQTRHLVDKRKLVHCQLFVRCLGWQLSEDLGPIGVHVYNQVFKLLFVHLEVLHAQVVGQAIPLVEVLPIVQVVVGVLLANTVHLDTVQVHWNEEQAGEARRGVDVATDVLIVEGDVDPRPGACKVRTHLQ